MPYKLNAVVLATSVILLTACSHKDSANAPATASSAASIDAADLAVDHAGNVIASAPVQTTTPAVTAPPAPAEPLPFIGTKEFNFDGGALTVQNITIKSNGTITLKEIHSDFGENQRLVTSFKGKFSNPLQLKDGVGLLFKDNKILRLDHGNIDRSCSDSQSGQENIPCSSELYSLE